MDLYTGNDVEAPDAPLWASALRKGRDNVVELACAGHWLRQLALRMAGHTRLGRTEEALRWWSVVKYCDSYLVSPSVSVLQSSDLVRSTRSCIVGLGPVSAGRVDDLHLARNLGC